MRSSSGFRIKLTYDEYNRASDVKFEYGSTDLTTSWVFGKSSAVYGVKYNGIEKISYAYDSLMRRTKTAINTTTPFVTNYSYKDIDLDRTTTQLSSISYSNGKAFKYTYDANGNVLDIKDQNDNLLVSYDYDALNQLTRENNAQLNKTITYTYDNGGNILSVKEYAFTTGDLDDLISEKTYTYGNSEWKDLLTNYNGINITYDTIGNPEKWINGEEFDWTGGRQLSGITKGNNTIQYTYNDSGIRTSKTVNNVRTDYYLNGTAIIMQKTGDNCIWYTYDENGLVTGFKYNGNEYYYFKNAQGDIIGIIDSSGAVIARYTYDAWGNHIAIRDGSGNDVSNNASHIANINPFRYRGYYFDTETEFYYLNSRYYDAEVCRFLNADIMFNTDQGVLGTNLFTYCLNNPVKYLDENGEFAITAAFVIAGIVATALSGLDMGISAAMNKQSFWKGFAAGSIGGIFGYVTGAFLNPLAGRAVGTALTGIANEYFQNGSLEQMDWGTYTADIIMDTTFSMLYAGEINFGNDILNSTLSGSADALVDITQTGLLYTEEAKIRIKSGFNQKNIAEIKTEPVNRAELNRFRIGVGKYADARKSTGVSWLRN